MKQPPPQSARCLEFYARRGFDVLGNPIILAQDFRIPGYTKVREVLPSDEELFTKVKRLCEVITGSPPDTTVKGEIESLALEIGHFRQILDANSERGARS